MFKIENNNIFYKEEPMIDWVHFGKVIIVDSTDIALEMEIKKFNLETETFEHYDGLIEYNYNGKIYPVENGFFTVEPAEPVTPVYVPTQLDRVEAAVLQSKQDIIDEYTLELLESGAL
jgi:hypothetical protein